MREDLPCCSGTCVIHHSKPRPLLDAANPHGAEICLTTGSERSNMIKKQERWRSGWQSGSGKDSYKVVTNRRERRRG